MTTRLDVDVIRPGAVPIALDLQPWNSSGVCTASTQVKSTYGVVGAIMVQATDNGTDQVLKVWDSEDSTTTDDVILYQCDLPEATDGARQYALIPHPGMIAQNGIYVEVAGDLEFEILYR